MSFTEYLSKHVIQTVNSAHAKPGPGVMEQLHAKLELSRAGSAGDARNFYQQVFVASSEEGIQQEKDLVNALNRERTDTTLWEEWQGSPIAHETLVQWLLYLDRRPPGGGPIGTAVVDREVRRLLDFGEPLRRQLLGADYEDFAAG